MEWASKETKKVKKSGNEVKPFPDIHNQNLAKRSCQLLLASSHSTDFSCESKKNMHSLVHNEFQVNHASESIHLKQIILSTCLQPSKKQLAITGKIFFNVSVALITLFANSY